VVDDEFTIIASSNENLVLKSAVDLLDQSVILRGSTGKTRRSAME
jgi:hypothetical protein